MYHNFIKYGKNSNAFSVFAVSESMTKSDDPSKVSQSGNLKRTFKKSLMEFIGCHVPYTIRRVLAAEAQHLYIGPFQGELYVNYFHPPSFQYCDRSVD